VRRDIPLAELADFLALPLVAVLATYRRDGGVLAELDTSAIIRDMAVRYLGRKAGEAYAATSGGSILIRLEPGHVRTWDFAGEI